jgi:hypothetical protein
MARGAVSAGAVRAAADPWGDAIRRGAWEDAWRVSDAVLRARGGAPGWHLPRHEQWVWDGTPVEGRRVLVRCYHGLGDTIMCARFLPALRARAAHVTLWVQPALLRLLARAPGVDALLPLHDGTPDVDYDVDVEVMELPHLLRATPASVAATVPYLDVPPAPRARDGRLHVGLVWESGDWNRAHRSVPPALLAPLGAAPGVVFHRLQRGAADAPGFGADGGSDDVYEAARAIRALDLVISIDSMAAHLAGAMGVPTWVLLAHDADWRWLEGRDDTPWYPTARLFRQPAPGEWAPVVDHVAARLRGRLSS